MDERTDERVRDILIQEVGKFLSGHDKIEVVRLKDSTLYNLTIKFSGELAASIEEGLFDRIKARIHAHKWIIVPPATNMEVYWLSVMFGGINSIDYLIEVAQRNCGMPMAETNHNVPEEVRILTEGLEQARRDLETANREVEETKRQVAQLRVTAEKRAGIAKAADEASSSARHAAEARAAEIKKELDRTKAELAIAQTRIRELERGLVIGPITDNRDKAPEIDVAPVDSLEVTGDGEIAAAVNALDGDKTPKPPSDTAQRPAGPEPDVDMGGGRRVGQPMGMGDGTGCLSNKFSCDE